MSLVYPSIRCLEMDITYICGMSCANCNRMTDHLPGRPEENITVKQVKKLLRLSMSEGRCWKKIAITGGEPTLHPQFFDILRLLHQYRNHQRRRKRTLIVLATHGNGDFVQDQLRRVRDEFPDMPHINSDKVRGEIQKGFTAPCVAPIDGPYSASSDHVYIGCPIPSVCGIGMNYKGFYPCAIAAAIDRVFHLDQFIPHSQLPTVEHIQRLYQTYCKLCGFYRPILNEGQVVISNTWIDQLGIRDYSV